VACVAENRPPYSQEVICLFKSIIAFGGVLANARKIAYFVDAVEPLISEELAQLGVIVKVVERFSDRFPHANKVRMLEESEDCDYLVALDTDVAIARDFSEMVAGHSIRAKPVDDDPLTMESWRKLFDYFGVAFPLTRFLTTFSLKETIPYFNSGVLVIPKEHVSLLSKSWQRLILDMEGAYSELPEVARHRFFTDQFAFALALGQSQLPYAPLPIEMNFPTHYPIHSAYSPGNIDPYVVHHHHRLSGSGELLACGYEQADRRIREINQAIKVRAVKSCSEARRKDGGIVDGAEFWERRYRDNPNLGSGVGSRGESLLYKRGILQSVVDRCCLSSILDVGCGDIEVVKGLSFSRAYVGVDLSPTVIRRNRATKPEWTFIEGDIRGVALDISAEMVICLDVLIHAPSFQDYEALVGELIRRTTRLGVVSGYQSVPRREHSSEITAYYEPITLTLRRFGAKEVQVIGSYRDTCIVMYEKPEAGPSQEFSR
jgi:SAM-dependent methyltransferase